MVKLDIFTRVGLDVINCFYWTLITTPPKEEAKNGSSVKCVDRLIE